MRSWLGTTLIALGLTAPALAQAPVDPGEKAWERALATWEDRGTWQALGARARAAVTIAKTKDPRGLALLLPRFQEPRQQYPELERLLLSGALQEFTAADHGAAAIDRLANAHAERSWLRFSADLVHAAQLETDSLVARASDEKQPVLQRCAALLALGEQAPPAQVSALLVELLGRKKLARQREAQRLLLSSCAGALLAVGPRSEREVWRDAALALVAWLDRRKLERPERGLIARHLAALLESEQRHLDAEPWRGLLAAAGAGAEGGTTRVRAQFMGLSTTGTRIVYVIDMSDSMLLPLSDAEREVLRRPVTGSGRRRGKKNDELPWDRIVTRFDVVREYLKLSLRSLERGTSFAVVGFGNRAETLQSTPQLIPANRRNLGAAIQELGGLQAGATTTTRKHGTLRGQTNLHAAVRLAFALTGRGRIETHDEHQHPEAVRSGCDAIFLLSDGKPTRWDYSGRGPPKEYPAYDVPASKYTYRDPETGEEREVDRPAQSVPARVGPQSAQGPYTAVSLFEQDLRRLNLYRKVEINAVGVGEYEEAWLRRVVDAGLGQLRLIGPGKSKSGN